MSVIRDEWTPLFADLQEKVSASGKRELLSAMIGEIEAITTHNFGASGINRPQEWPILSARYAKQYHDGDRTPTLMLSGEMLESFSATVDENSASLTNLAPYADEHLPATYAKNKSTIIPPRPYYPIDDSEELTPFAQFRMAEIIDAHFSTNPF
jgi:phage gpG-like protein